jgi:phenylacetate-CoA ligase
LQDPFAAVAALPLLDKRTIRENLAAMTCRNVPGGPIRFATGGSTGHPLVLYVDRGRIAADKAARLLTHTWFGVKCGDPEVYLWGSPIELRAQDALKRLRDRLTNETLLEAFHLSPSSMGAYLTRMNAIDPVSIFGYPSSLTRLAEFGVRQNLRFCGKRLRTVFTSGELLDEQQRDTLSRFFRARVADGFGSRDGGFIAHECEAGRMHAIDQHLVIEVVDDDGRPVAPGETGEIVITHLEALATPLLRYRTGDLGALHLEPCRCGRNMTVLGVVAGRRTDHLVASDGSLSHGLSAIYVLREMTNIEQFQVRQKRDRSIEVLVAPSGEFGDAARERIRHGITRQLGEAIDVCIKTVERIESARSGKFRQVVCEVGHGAEHGLPWGHMAGDDVARDGVARADVARADQAKEYAA